MANPTPVTMPTRNATAGVAVAWTAATGSAQTIPWMPGGILLARNVHGTLARTVTVVSNPKARRAATTISGESLAAGIIHVFPRFPAQDNDTLTITGSTTDIEFMVLDTKAQPA